VKFGYLQVAQEKNIMSVSVAEAKFKFSQNKEGSHSSSVDRTDQCGFGFDVGCFEQSSSESAVKRFGR